MANHCDNCALRLYNKDKVLLKGTGNLTADRIAVLPYVDRIAFKKYNITEGVLYNDLSDAIGFLSSTGQFLQEMFYVTHLVKCKLNHNVNIDTIVNNNCIHYFIKEINYIRPRYIFLYGNAIEKILNISVKEALDKVYVHNNIIYFSNYNPSAYRYNEELKEEFINLFIKHLDAINYNDYSNFKIIRL